VLKVKLVPKIVFVVLLISGVCTVTSARPADLPKTAELLPPETHLLVDISDFSQLKDQFEKTSLYKLYKDPAMTDFVAEVKTKWNEKVSKLDNKIAEVINDANVLPEGKVALAFVGAEQAKGISKLPFLLITQWGKNINKIKQAVDKMTNKAVENGAHVTMEDYRDIAVKKIIEEKSTFSLSFIDDCLIVSVSPDILEFVIAQIKGAPSPTLADDSDYTSIMSAVGPYHDIDFYVNAKQIIKTAIAEDTSGAARAYISSFGVDNVAALGCSVGLARGTASSFFAKAFLKINGTKKGICRMLDAEQSVLRTPRFIPTSAYSVTFFNLNMKKAYNELNNILYAFNPASAAGLNAPLLPATSADGKPELELKSGIIDHLGSQIIIAHSMKKPFSLGSVPRQSLYAIAIENRNALEKSLSLLHSKILAPNNPDARRELLGHTIYVVDVSAMMPFFMPGQVTPMQAPRGPAGPPMPKLAFSFTDTYLISGLESTVEQAIRTLNSDSSASVDSAGWFTQAKSAIPSLVGFAGLEDNEASAELFWWMIKQIPKAGSDEASLSMGITMAPSPGMMLPQTGLDFGLLPQFDAVREYFGLSTFYGISRPDGFIFEFKNLNPPSSD
jgi:hypothetical protein